MLEPRRTWRRWAARVRRRGGASPARWVLVLVLVLAALGLLGAAASLPQWLRARFEARSRALEVQLARAADEASEAFRAAALDALQDADASAGAAQTDPFALPGELAVWQAGVRTLPPSFACRAEGEGPEELAAALVELKRAARGTDEAALETAVRAWLAARVHHQVPRELELHQTLEALEALSANGRVRGELMDALVRGGLAHAGQRAAPLESVALLGLPGACDPALLERVGRLLLAHGVDDQRLRRRLEEWRALPVEVPPATSGLWVRGGQVLTQVDVGGRALVIASPAPMSAARAAVAAAAATSEVQAPASGGWTALGEVRIHLTALEELGPARARFDAALRALTLAAGTLCVGGVLLFGIDRRRRRSTELLRRDLVAAVAHELKTPLASMRLQADALERWVDDERAGRTLARLQEDVDALEGLVENVLSWGRLSRGGVVLRERDVSLLELVRETLERARREHPGLVAELAGDDVVVRADGELLQLVLGNLVRNAWRHNPRSDKHVRVQVERVGDRARVAVSDNGAGIDPVEQARIFRPFERSLTLSRGSGLGLTLGREIAELHGGDVRLASTSPEGSTFVLELPL